MQLIGCAEEQISSGIMIGFVIKKIKWENNNWSESWYVIELNWNVMCLLLDFCVLIFWKIIVNSTKLILLFIFILTARNLFFLNPNTGIIENNLQTIRDIFTTVP